MGDSSRKYKKPFDFKQVAVSFSFALAIVFASGCSPFHTSSGQGSSNGTSGHHGGPKGAQGLACYLNGCFNTLPIADIVDPNHDYQYQDPKNFPTAGLRGQYIAPAMVIDLNGLNMKSPLSANFLLGDFMNVDHGRYALFSSNVLMTIQKMREELSKAVYITSGYRSPSRNNQTDGSAQWSRHMYGDALDFSSDRPDYNALQTLCQKHQASFTLIYKTHIHCDWRLAQLDPSFYNATPPPPLAAQETDIVANDVAAKSSIVELARTSRSIVLGVLIGEIETEGDLNYSWSIRLPDQRQIFSDQAKIELPLMSGFYKIKVIVGGSIQIERHLDLK